MGDNAGADYAIQNLNGLTLFNEQISIQYSKHPCIKIFDIRYTIFDKTNILLIPDTKLLQMETHLLPPAKIILLLP